MGGQLVLDAYDLALEKVSNERDFLRMQNGRLQEALLLMKKEGYQYQGPAITDSPSVTLPEEVLAAISYTSGSDEGLAYDQSVYAQSLIDAGMDADEVAKEILQGSSVEISDE